MRDKTNITNITYGLDFINKLRPVQFEWNSRDGSKVGVKDLGFIAQDLDQLEQDFDSQDYTQLVYKENLDRLEANYMRSYPILVKAVQELSTEVERLKNIIKNMGNI